MRDRYTHYTKPSARSFGPAPQAIGTAPRLPQSGLCPSALRASPPGRVVGIAHTPLPTPSARKE